MEMDEEEDRLSNKNERVRLPKDIVLSGNDDEEEEEDPGILDLRGRGMEKLTRALQDCVLNTTTLLLDDNALQRLDNIYTYQCIEKLSVQNNRLTRIFQVSKLNHLKILNLANNSIVAMEGLKELKLLSWLSLASNNIKTIENLNQNVHLEHLDLSSNNIPHISDMSYLRNLKTLLLHRNRIGTLRLCDRHLPSGLSTLTLNDNQLMDLTDVCHLTHLTGLEQLTLANNPCIFQPEELNKQFDYRPFVINWCLSLQILDGIPVGAKESLKAEWMYSQSKGRHFAVGQHSELKEYLLSVCPLHPDENWEEDKKLNLILSKVQEHQSSLRQDSSISSTPSVPGTPRSNTLPRSSTVESPRSNTSSLASPGRRNSDSLSRRIFSSSSSEPFRRQGSLGRNNVRRYSRTSPSPVRRSTTPPSTRLELGSYPLALPRKLYDNDDINGNSNNNFNSSIMTQSMRVTSNINGQNSQGIIGSVKDDNLMTTSLDPSMFGNVISDDSFASNANHDQHQSVRRQQSTNVPEAWLNSGEEGSSLNRPNALFQGDTKDVKDIYLQDLSEKELSQSLIYTRLQSRLNPVPESLNSPDIPVPNNRPNKDDPLLSYGIRDSLYHSGSEIGKEQRSPAVNGYSSSASEDTVSSVVVSVNNNNIRKSPMQQPKRTRKKSSNDYVPSKVDTGLVNRKVRSSSSSMSLKKSLPSNDDNNKNDGGLLKASPKNSSLSAPSDDGRDDESESDCERKRLLSNKNTSRSNKENSEKNKTEPTMRVATVTKRITKLPRSQSARLVTHEPTPSKSSSQNNLAKNEKNRLNRSSSSKPPKIENNNKGIERQSSQSKTNPQMNHSATVIQKTWKGHFVRNKDKKVQELKVEIRAMRGEDHIRYLTKELQSTKQALEKERKLRALQMDALKVLWKEVQMMDATKGNPDRARPSGSSGSKISSRSSEHSIAKLMETLEATTGTKYNSSKAEDSITSPATSKESDAVRALNATCGNLQNQVEQLQGSLRGIIKFMSAFTNIDMDRTRPSSSASQDASSFSCYQQPASLPSSLVPLQSNDLLVQCKNKIEEIPAQKPVADLIQHHARPKSLVLETSKVASDAGSETLLKSPQAPAPVKAYARILVDDLISDTVYTLDNSKKVGPDDLTDISLSLNDEDDLTEVPEESKSTAISTNNTPTPTEGLNSINSDGHSSHIETDSLEGPISPFSK